MFGNIGPLEIGIVLVIVLLVFGPKRLPELGRSTGKALRGFKESVNDLHVPGLGGDEEKEEPAPKTKE